MTKEELQKVREALEAAEALMIDMGVQSSDAYQEVEHALPLIDTALAQTDGEPVGYQNTDKHSELIAAEDWGNIDPQWHWMYRALYAAPVAQKGAV